MAIGPEWPTKEQVIASHRESEGGSRAETLAFQDTLDAYLTSSRLEQERQFRPELPLEYHGEQEAEAC